MDSRNLVTDIVDATEPPGVHACSEVWAGNSRTTNLFELPGLTAWVHSVPAGQARRGGDVQYVSVCPSCIVSRIALADVSGHGEAVKAFGEKLRDLMHLHLRALEQIPLMRDLNVAVREEFGGAHYATLVAIGWHARRGLLVMTNAGHPPPLWYRASRDEWTWLETRRGSHLKRPAGRGCSTFVDTRPIQQETCSFWPSGPDRAATPSASCASRY